MESGTPLNWLLAVAMLGFAILAWMTGRVTLRGGWIIIDRAEQPTRFWMHVIGSGFLGVLLFAKAIFRVPL